MNLFVVNTPLQLLNAIEAKSDFNLTDCTVVILMWPHWSRPPFEAILRYASFDSVEYFNMRARGSRCEPVSVFDCMLCAVREYRRELSQLFFRHHYEKFLRRFSPVDRLFIGNYRNGYMIHVGNVVRYNELVLLDDGTDVLSVAQARLSRTIENTPILAGPVRRLKNKFRRKYIDWDWTQAPVATFFTSYEIQLSGQDQIVHNDYAQLKKRLIHAEHSDEIYFLGQPLVADGYLGDATFASYLAEIRDYFSDRPLFYIPHPREKEVNYVDHTSALDFEILRFDVPIEIVLCSATRAPAVIASFFCSALENCSFLFPEGIDIMAFEIQDQDLLCCNQLVNDSYDHFRTKRGKTIRLVQLEASTPKHNEFVSLAPKGK